MSSRIIIIVSLLFSLFFTSASYLNAYEVYPQKGNCPRDDQVETAIGCISTNASGADSFFTSIIKVAVGLGGGLALLLMLYGTFIITTSAGIPDKLKEGKEILTSAISGLIFIILSVVLLNLIGIQILGLPGLQ